MTSTDLVLREAIDGRIAQLRDPEFEQQVALAVPEGVSARKLLRAAATAVLENPELARDDLKASLIRATLKTAQDGLLPDGREAAFVIFGGKEPKIQYMPMLGGLRKIAAEHGWSIFTAVVCDKDAFDPDYENGKANHKPPRLGSPRGDVIGAYAAAEHTNGRRMLEVMDLAEIEKVRQVSRAKDRGPWVDWFEQMAQKTVARRLFKKLPLDPKDAERIDRVSAAAGEDGIVELYGEEPSGDRSPDERAPVAAPPEPVEQTAGSGTDLPAPGSEDVPFEGEEPPPVTDELQEEPVVSAGRHSGKTIPEIYALGKEGVSYLQWMFTNWKTSPLRERLDAFAAEHKDIAS